MRERDERKEFSFDDEEDGSWKEKFEEKAEEVTEDIEKKFHLTETEKNLEAFHREKSKDEKDFSGLDSFDGLDSDQRDEKGQDDYSEDDWKEEIDIPTFIVLSVEIVLLTYFILAVLGYVPFF